MRVLDLFCGAGGLAQGFTEVGFDVTGVDISEQAGRTFELNTESKFIEADLSKELIDGDYDTIIGGPSCKPWSAVNLRKRGKHHSDYDLLSSYFEHIEHHLPTMFLLENVPSVANDETFKKYIRRLTRMHYSIECRVIAYSTYGAPTRRHRLIAFGEREGNASIFFEKLSEYVHAPKTVRDVIWQLRNKRMGEVPDHIWPILKTINKYQKYYETGKFGWYILKWDEPAPSFGNIMKTYILHPDASKSESPRVISVREALLIMGFNQDFQFPQGIGMGLKYQMVADAVSPMFSYVAAKVLRELRM